MERRPLVPLLLVLLGLLASAPAGAAHLVCIDPGHGGSDPGAVGCGLEEAAVNLDVALRLRDLMDADPDLDAIVTRTTDATVSLAARVAFANDHGANRFASIHCNAFNGSATGIETYCYSNGSAKSFDQRDRIQAAMTATWPALFDRGVKTAGFYVIANTSMPATLSELAFIDNCGKDALYLGNPSQRQAAAAAHHQALRLSLGLGGALPDPEPDPEPDPGPDPGGTGVLRGVVYQDLGVGSADMSQRLPGAKVTASGGPQFGQDTAGPLDADWMISLPASSYTVTASLDGYHDNTRVCSVAAGETTWCSIGLFVEDDPADPPPPGVLRGVVYEDLGVGDQDMSVRLPAALVAIQGPGGASDVVLAAAGDGSWLFSVPAGTWTVTATLEGYWLNSRLCEVLPGGETWCSIGLHPAGVDPPPDPDPPAGPSGVLRGLIFEELGEGLGDMSVHLPGATVTVAGSAASATLAADAAAQWSLVLPPGTYQVSATRTGYWPNTRLCAVAEGVETWCSLGLWPEDEEPPDDPTPGYGGPPGEGAWEEPPPELPGEPEVPGAGEDPGATVPGETPQEPGGEDSDVTSLTIGGCDTSPTSGADVVLLVLLAAAGLCAIRRRRAVGLPLAAALLLAYPSAADERPGLRVVDVRAVTPAGGYLQPVWSPDGSLLAFSGERFASLLTVPAAGGPVRELVAEEGAGYEPRWSPDGRGLEHRLPGQLSGDIPARALLLDGSRGLPPAPRPEEPQVLVREDRVLLVRGPVARGLSPEGDRFCCARGSPDGGRVAFTGLETGIHVHDIAAGRTTSLGAGTSPRFSPDGARLAFERCEDDGRELTACTLFVAELGGAAPRPVPIAGAPAVARRPALSPDGRHLAWDADGIIWVGRLVEETP